MALSIPIITEFSGKGIERARKEFKQLETVGQKAQFALKKATIPATAALAGLAGMARKSVMAASDLAEAQSKVGVIFGDGAKEIEDFAKTAAKRLGQSRRAVLDAAGTFGTFGKAAGLGGRDLAKFSNDFTALASDLASFNNTTPEDAIQAIGAALRGEAEPMRRFGVLLNDAALKAAALELKIYDGSGALTDQQKILAAQKIIFEQTQDAQGDFERTSEGLANSQRQLSAMLDDTTASIGEALLPVVEAVLPLVKDFAEWASENPDTFRNIAAAIAAVAASTVALNAAMAVNPYVLAAAGITAMALAFEKLYDEVAKVNKIGGIAARVFGFLFGGPAGKLGSMLEIQKFVNGIFGVKKQPKRGDGFTALEIPMMADGGIVTGPTLAMIGEAGPEAVIPLDRAGMVGGGTTVNINVQGADPQAVVDALRTYMYRNGSVPIRVAS